MAARAATMMPQIVRGARIARPPTNHTRPSPSSRGYGGTDEEAASTVAVATVARSPQEPRRPSARSANRRRSGTAATGRQRHPRPSARSPAGPGRPLQLLDVNRKKRLYNYIGIGSATYTFSVATSARDSGSQTLSTSGDDAALTVFASARAGSTSWRSAPGPDHRRRGARPGAGGGGRPLFAPSADHRRRCSWGVGQSQQDEVDAHRTNLDLSGTPRGSRLPRGDRHRGGVRERAGLRGGVELLLAFVAQVGLLDRAKGKVGNPWRVGIGRSGARGGCLQRSPRGDKACRCSAR